MVSRIFTTILALICFSGVALSQNVTLQKTVDNYTAQSGEYLTYSLDYGCSSLTTDCAGAVLTDTLPAEVEFQSATPAIVNGQAGSVAVFPSYDSISHTVTWDFAANVLPEAGLPDGSSGTVQIVVKIKTGVIPNNDSLLNKAILPSTNAGTATDTALTVTQGIDPNANWSLTKSVTSGNIYHDEDVTYRLSLCPLTDVGNQNIHSIVVTDTLPAGAVFQSATLGGVHDGGTPGIVTWTFTDTMLVNGNCRNMDLVVRYPYADTVNNNTGLTTPIPKINIGKFSALAVVDSTMVMGTDSVNDPLLPPFFSIGLTKDIPDVGAVPIDSIYKYILTPSNNSTATVNSFIVTDSIPDQFDLLRLDFMAFNTSLPVTIRAELNHSGSWTVWQTNVTADQNHIFDVTSIPGFTTGDFVSAVQIDFGNVPKGFGGGSIELVIMPSYPLDNAGVTTPLFTAFRNTGYLTGINPFDGSGLSASDSADVCVIPGNLTRIATDKSVAINYVTPPAGDPTTGNPYFMGSRVQYTLLVENDGPDGNDPNNSSSVSQGPLIDPIVADLLPAGMTYEAGSYQIVNNTTGLTFGNSGTNPTFEMIPNFNGTGKTLLRWRFTGTFDIGESAEIQYNAYIDSANPSGTVLLNEYAIAMDTLSIICDANVCGIPDTTGLLDFFATSSGSGVPIPGVNNFCANSIQITVADTTSAPRPSKTIISSGPYAPAETPNVELGLATDTVEYSIQLCNAQSANYTMPDPVLMDLLPAELEYVNNSITLTGNTTGLTLTPSNPLIEVIPDFQATGRTLLRWTFTGDFPINKCVTYSFKTRIKPGSGGTIINEPLASVGDRVVSCTGELVETLDLNGNAIVGDTLCTAVVNPNFAIPEIRSLRTKKFVKGAKNPTYLGSDLGQLGVGCTYHGDSVLWRFKISNPGNVTLTNAVVVDVFPYLGDVGVKLNTTPRFTEWVPYLVDTVRTPNPNIKIWYSQSTNPCRPEVEPVISAGCVNDWTMTVPANLADVKAVKFDFSSEVLSPGEEYWFDISMLAPDSIQMNPGIAWNSVAGDAAEVPSNEPNKVGIIINGFDVALKKTLASGQGYLVDPGSDVTYTIKIYNQGTDSVKNVSLIDYIPPQMTLNDANWTAAAGNTATRTIPGPIAPDDSVAVNITLNLSPAVVTGDIIDNYAEITGFEDMAGNTPLDWDAVNDNTNGNDAGGTIESPADDAINGNGQGTVPGTDPATDEDDHDGARVRVCPSFTQNSAQDQEVCTDNLAALNDIIVPTTANPSELVKFVAFPSQQSPPNMYTGGATLAIVNPSGGNATLPAASIPTSLGTHYIYAILEPAPADPNCRPYDLVIVQVNPPIVANAGPDVEICDGFSTTLTASATGGNGNYSYAWSNGANSASTLVSPSPAGVYTYIVTVTDNSGNCSDVDTVLVTVNPNPTVSAGMDVDTCVNAPVTITATPGGGTPGYTYLWSNGNTNQSQVVMVDNPTTFTVTVTDTKGCTATDAMNINVPVADAGPNAAICLNDSATLTASGGVSYAWSNGGSTASIIVSPPATTTYYVTVTDAIGCTDVDSTLVTVYPLPTVDAGPNVEICNGQSTNLTAVGSGGTPGYSYAWDNGLGNGASKTVSPTATTTYHVTITDSHGCSGTDSVTVTVNPLPVANAGADTTVCLGTAATITATATGGTPGYSYTWNQGLGAGQSHTFTPTTSLNYRVTVTDSKGCTDTDVMRVNVQSPTANAGPDVAICLGNSTTLTASGGISYNWSTGDTTASITVSPAATTTYNVTVTDALGCTDADSVVVTVYQLPMVDAGLDVEICNGQSTTITAVGSGGASPYSYLWSNGLGSGASKTVSPTATTKYYVTLTDANGCTALDSVTVTVNQLPTVTASPDTTICLSGTADLDATASGGTPGYSFAWDNGLGAGAMHSVSPPATTTYTVTVTDSKGCTDTDQSIVTIQIPPANAGPDQAICIGDTATLTATGGISYVWNTSDSVASIIVVPASTTSYSVTVTDALGCQAADTAIVTVNPLPTPGIAGNLSICQGESTTLTASGGTTYLWSNGATTAAITVSPLSTTLYSVTVTDGNSCSADTFATVVVKPVPVAQIAGATTICNGESTTLTATGGGTYAWNTGATTAAITVSPTSNTTYTVTVTSANGCTDAASATVTVNPLPTAAIAGTTTICNGESTLLVASGGVGYLWNTGQTNDSIFVSPTATTTYSVTVTDANGCTDVASATVTVNPLPTASITGVNVICSGDSTTLTASGGSSYLWSTGATTAGITVSPLSTTTYSVTVTDANGCTDVASRTVTVNPLPNAAIAGDTIICAGENTTLTASGGSGYTWSTGATTASITVSPAATTSYTVTVTNANGCTDIATATVMVDSLPPSAISGNTTICLGESTTLTATGGGTYLWSNGATSNSITVSPTANTTYSVTVTIGSGCTASTSATVTVNPLPTASITGVNVICSGDSTTLTASGGSSYVWSTGATTASIAVSPAATTTYSVTVTDANGCTDVASRTVTVNPLPNAAIAGDTIICAGENTTLTASGGSGYTWSTGATTASITVSPAATTSYTVTVTNANGCTDIATATVTVNALPTAAIAGNTTICEGDNTTLTASGGSSYVWNTGDTTASIAVSPTATTSYSVTVTDANGCSDAASATVTVNPLPTASITGVNVICSGDSTTLTASGGSGYLWSTGATTASIAVSPPATTTYSVTVTDANGCTDVASRTVTVNPLPNAAIAGDTIICAGENTILTASGGSGYTWSTGATTASITVSPSATTSYTVTVTNANGCTDIATATVMVDSLPPSAISGNTTICLGESTTLTATGGGTYLWSNGATSNSITVSPTANTTYSVTVTIGSGCTASTSATVTVNPLPTASITGDSIICEGDIATLTAMDGDAYLWGTGDTTAAIAVSPATTTNYSVTVTNSFGCTATASSTVIVLPRPTAAITGKDTICYGTNTTLTATGGVGYQWSNGATTASITVNPSVTTTYTVTVTASNGCTDVASATVVVNPLPVPSISGNNVICYGDSTTLTASGGVSYLWSNGATTAGITVAPTSNTNYSVTVTNASGCTASTSVPVIVNQLPVVSISGDTSLCIGENTVLIASGGIAYNWSTGANTAAINETPLVTTTYSVTVTGTNGCTATDSVTVNVHPYPVASISGDTVICTGDATTLTAAGAQFYLWDTGDTTASITVAPSVNTTYHVTVTTQFGCSDTDSITVHLDTLPVAVITGVDTICLNDYTTLTASGGSSYLWSNGATTAGITVTPASSTTYTVTVTDDNGCTGTASVPVTVLPLPTPSISGNSVICFGDTTTLTASGGVSYLWSTGETTTSIAVSPAATTTYSVTATDANGCSDSTSITITVNPLPPAAIAGDTMLCIGDSTVLTASGGVSYFWSTGASTASITVAPLVTTHYMVFVTDANGCTDTAGVTVVVNDLPVAAIDGDSVICFGETAILTASGGTDYLWSTGDTTASISVSPSANSVYSVTVSLPSGCSAVASHSITVHPTPTPSISGDTLICRGDTAILTAFGGGSYLWNTGDTTSSIVVVPDSTTLYTVTVTNQYGCSATATHLLNVNQLPDVVITGGPYHCDGDTTILTASGGVSYLWSTGASTPSIAVSPSVNTNYGVLVTGANGCTNTASITLDVQFAQDTVWADTICAGESYDFFGQQLTATGTYHDTLFYASGCDSQRYTLNLYVRNDCVLDLALRKTPAVGQVPLVTLGDTVTFTVSVFNQGTVPAYNIQVLDYKPASLTYHQSLNPGWFDFGGGPAWIIPGPLQPGDSISQDIQLVVNLNALDTNLVNWAEITAFDNDTNPSNTPPTDVDSTPDAFNGNDAGGQIGSPADDYIYGDGTGVPGDGIAPTDEDDHDGAQIQFLPPPPLSLGNLVFEDFDNDGLYNNNDVGIPGVSVELYNAGPDGLKGTADDFLVDTTVTDANGEYLFTGLSHGLYWAKLNGNGIPAGYFSSTGDGPHDMDGQGPFEPAYGAFLDLDNADDGTQMGNMIMTDTIRLFYWSEPTFEDGDENSNLTLDFGLFSPTMTQFDLALFKDLAAGQSAVVDINDDVDYTICVVNEGNVTGYNIKVLDVIPQGMILSPNDNNGWTLLSPDSAVVMIPGALAVGDTACVNIKLRLIYALSSATLINNAEIYDAEDVNGDPLPDMDSTPDNGAPDEDDIDQAPVNVLPHDPTGWIYCEATGEIITGGTVSVTGPGTVFLVADGSNGYYEFYTDGTPGVYTLTYNHPAGYPLSTTCLPQGGPFDPTNMADPVVLGADTLSGLLSDPTCAANPYYMSFTLEPGDPLVTRNNLPVQCVSVGSIVCTDSNNNDSTDVTDPPVAGITVYLYDCADTLNPLAITVTDSLGQYSFTGLPAGNYRVFFDIPAGYRPVSTGLIAPDGFSPCVTLNWGDQETSLGLCLHLCPEVTAGLDRYICLGDTTTLVASVPYGAGNYSWTPGTGLSNPNAAVTQAYPAATTTYVVTYDDGLGCTSSDTVTVYTQISIPTLGNNPDTVLQAACDQNLPWFAPVFIDQCDQNLTILFDSTLVQQPCGYDLVRTWTAINRYDMTANFTQVVQVRDTTPPVFTFVPADTTLASCNDMAMMPPATATDNCDNNVTITVAETMTTGPDCAIIVTKTYTATDDCGNTATATQVITTYDTEVPQINVTNPALAGLQEGDTLYMECQVVGNLGPDDVTVTDDCGNADVVFLEYDSPLQNCATAGYVQLLRCGWTATDMCGNQDSLFFFVVVIDTTPPELYTVPADVMLMCNDPVPPAPTVYAVDNCDNNVPVTFTENTLPGTIVRTWTATDDCGNTVVGTQTINFDGGLAPPVIYNVPADTTISCEDPLPAPDPSVYAIDACDPDPALVVNDSIAGGGCGYTVYRTWTATDFDGNSSSATQVITVIDAVPPVLSGIPSEITIECGQPVPPVVYPTATDNCDTNITVDLVVLVNDQDSCDIVINRIFTATDDCGNQAGFHQHIHLIDTTAPVITVTHPQLVGVPSGDTLTFECDAVPILDDNDAYATDGCDQAPLLYRTETIIAQPNCQGEDYMMLMRCGWLAQDQCGNESEWFVYFRVVDTQAPVIAGALPADLTVDCGQVPAPPALDSIVVTDNCDLNPVLSLTDSIIAGGCPGDYVILRTLTATDQCGNVSSLTQTINVEDQTPPVLSGVPADVTVDCGNVPAPPVVTATDNCDSDPLVTMNDVQTNGCPYTIFRTWTATDACGNSSSQTQRIRVEDNQAPAFDHLPADTTVSCNGIPPVDTLVATDNCDTSLVVTFGETTSGSGCNYTITRTWTATDDCGNTFVHTQDIQVIDNEAPTFSRTPADMTVACGNVPPADTLSISDNCDPAPALVFNEVTGSGCPYTITRTWTATDGCGNADSIVQVITVVDTLAPQLAGVPADTTLQCGEVLPVVQVTATDNCADSVALQYTEVIDSTDLCDVVVTRTWTATDDCGNVATATQTIHIIDTLAPAIVFNHPWLAGLHDGDTLVMDCSNTEVFGAASADAVDECNDAVIGFTEGSVLLGDCENEGFLLSLNCKWTATDACGNSASITITMVIVDTLPPVFTSVPADTTLNCGEPVPPYGAAVADDACGNALIAATQDTVMTTSGYDLVRTYTAIDDCGNVATATQTIHVLDGGAPVLTGVPADSTIYSNQGQTVPDPAVVSAYDDCTGNTIPVTFTEFTGLVPGGGCDTLITRIWTATDGAGNTVADTQLIVVVGGYDVTVITAPDTCGFGNGSVMLQPDTLNYLWSDGYVGAFRDSLPAGTYTAYVSDGGCTDTLVFDVPAICPCIAPVVDSIEMVDATCGNADGAATILLQSDPSLYNYLWLPNHGTPNQAGNGRTNLPAGHYVVIVEQPGLDSCFAKVEFTIGDDCPDCTPLFNQDTLLATSQTDPANVCLPVPYTVSQGYNIYLDGNLYTLPLGQCNNETVVFYTYALVTGQGQTGPYDVLWVHGVDTLMTTVNNMDELVAAMNAVDSAGMWYNQPDLFGLTSMNIGGNYGDMVITHVASQNSAMISPNFTSTPMGTQISVPAGVHEVVYENQTDGCTDTLTVVVTITPPLPGDIFLQKLVVKSGNCDYTDLSTCLDIAYSDLPDYDFELNGQPFTGAFDICGFSSEHYYTYVSVPGMGAAGPYTLEDWTINGQHFSGVFDDIEELVALMNDLDPAGNWQLEAQTFVIVGGGNNQYGPLKVRQNSTGAAAVMDVNTNTSAGQARVTLPEGENTFVAIRKADGFSDTLKVMVACVHADYFSNVIDMNEVDTICLDLDEIMGEVTGLENICQSNSGAAQISLIPGTWCLQCIGMEPGQTSACFVLCDEYGICDTTYIDVEVRAVAESETKLGEDNLTTLINQPVTGDVLANDQFASPVLSLNIVQKPQHGAAIVNNDNTITYIPAEDYCNDFEDATQDHFLYEVCTADGCFTAAVWVTVRCSDLVIYTGFSPNGDGVNDTFVIEGLQKYPNHSLRIFNRWGNLVFRTKNYQNDWGGTWGQNDLPDGTYFYLLDLGDGTQYTGYIEINR